MPDRNTKVERPTYEDFFESKDKRVDGYISIWLESKRFPHFYLIKSDSVIYLEYLYNLYQITLHHKNGHVTGWLDITKGDDIFDILETIHKSRVDLLTFKNDTYSPGCFIYLEEY